MKARIDIPDALYRRIQAQAALEGRTIREVTIDLYERWLREGPVPPEGDPESWLQEWFRAADEALSRAPPGASARGILEEDRGDRERPR